MEITIEQDSDSEWYIATVDGEDFSFATQGKTKIQAVIMAADGLRQYMDIDEWSDDEMIILAIETFHTDVNTQY